MVLVTGSSSIISTDGERSLRIFMTFLDVFGFLTKGDESIFWRLAFEFLSLSTECDLLIFDDLPDVGFLDFCDASSEVSSSESEFWLKKLNNPANVIVFNGARVEGWNKR